jgi:RNA polymerase sigma factor (sigma-70 family)
MKKGISHHEEMIGVATRKSLLERLKNPKNTDHWQSNWQEFYDNYWHLIFRFARSLGLSEEEAKDTVHETVLCITKKIPSYDYRPEEARFSSWLGGIAYRKALKECAKRKRRERLVAELDSPDEDDARPLEKIADPASDVCQKWQLEWEQHLLAQAMHKVKTMVSDEHYQMFDYHVVQGHSAEETAETLGTTASAVYTAVSRARALIRKEVEKLRKQPI